MLSSKAPTSPAYTITPAPEPRAEKHTGTDLLKTYKHVTGVNKYIMQHKNVNKGK